ncbi:MAG: hypothetical protein K0U13_06385, partial [Chlamydiae bacterium]|nr:hypothetical protein [Chlamydiota bacterium]
DLLRLDAIHGIYDFSATPMLSELSPCQIIAEDERNDCRYIRNQNFALWNDDFHHALHSLLTGEKQSYYSDFNGLESLARCLDRGLVYDGNYSNFRKKRQGNSSKNVPYSHFISFIQNHDQVGNRPEGERLGQLVSKEREKIAAAIHILSPMTPMLFMGQEYGEQNPFQYFVDFEDQKLMEAVTEGRKREFHSQQMPHPGQESFENSKLSWEKDEALFVAYKQLLEIRKQFTPKEVTSENVVVDRGESWLSWEYPTNRGVLNILLVWGECHHKPVGRVIYSTKPIPADWNFQDELLLVQIRS